MAKQLGFWQRLNPFRKRYYEGAAKTKRLRTWRTPSTSANAEILMSLEMLRNRSRDLRRNNPFAARAIQGIMTNTVGPGIQTQFREPAGNAATNAAEQDWRSWALTKNFDFDRRYDITGFQRMIMQAVPESGELIIRKRIDRKRAFPMTYQILEADFIDTTKNEAQTDTNNSIIQGVEFDKRGAIVAYWLYEYHPGGFDEGWRGFRLSSVRVPADQIIHLYRQERPGQVRGVPWLSPAIVRLKNLDDFEDAQLMRQKVAACFTAFVQDISADSVNEEAEAEKEMGPKIEPAQIEFLPPGKTVTFADPPESPNFDAFTKNVLRSVAAGIGVSYEVLTGDLSQVNFSSARMGWLEFMRNLQVWRQDLIMDRFLDVVVEDFQQMSLVMGKDFTKFSAMHTPPRREMIDPQSETAAIVNSIRAGISTLTEELLALGKDPIEHLNQYKKDKELIESLGLILDSDASKTMKAGITQQFIADADGNVKKDKGAQQNAQGTNSAT